MAKKDVNIAVALKDSTAAGFKSLTGNMKDVEKGLGSLAFKYGDVIAGAAAGMMIKNIMDSTLAWGQSVNDLVDATGMMDSEASRLLYTCRAVGLTTEEVTGTIGIFSAKIMEARDSMKAAVAAGKESDDTFSRYGISIMDASGNLLSYEQVLRNVIERHRSMANGMEKNNLEKMLFGRSGMKLNDLLNLTNEQLDQFAENCRKAGLEMKENGSAGAEEYTFAVNELDLALEGLKVQLGEELLPVLKENVDWVAGLVRQYRDLPAPAQSAAENIAVVAAGLAALSIAMRTVIFLGGPLMGVLAAIGGVGSATVGIAGGISFYKYNKMQDERKRGIVSYRGEDGEMVHKNVGPSPQQMAEWEKHRADEDYFGSVEWQKEQDALAEARNSAAGITEIRDKAGGGGGSKTDKAAKEVENATRKLQKVLQRINQDIANEIGSIFDAEMIGMKDELENLQREIDAAARLGIDTTEAKEKLAVYETVMTEKAQREQRRRNAEFLAEMIGLDGEYYKDRRMMIEADYQDAVAALEEETHEKLRQVGDKAKADEWYANKKRVIEQKKRDDLAEELQEDSRRNLEHAGVLVELEGLTQSQMTVARRNALTAHISLLQEQLRVEKLSADERLRIEQELSESIKDLRSERGKDPALAFQEGFYRLANQEHDYAQTVVDGFNSIFSSFEENVTSAIDGSKKFSEAIGDMAKDVIKSMTQMYVKMLVAQLQAKIFGSMFGNVGGGSAMGSIGASSGAGLASVLGGAFAKGGRAMPGSTYLVGEEGPELLQVGYQSQVISNPASRAMMSQGGGVGPVEIVVINRSKEEVKSTQSEAKFDGTRTVVTLFLDGVSRNVGGVRDILTSMGGGR